MPRPELTPEAITQRLRELARLSAQAHRRPTVDMSGAGVTARLRELGELSDFCSELMRLGAANRRKRAVVALPP
ncbi:MAG: hypothetical protein M3Y59_00780 [Myxococcota bacterium]|nr:hypothetical protein [Myxococcota bacterium]